MAKSALNDYGFTARGDKRWPNLNGKFEHFGTNDYQTNKHYSGCLYVSNGLLE
jgi:hypothetical protein